MPDSPSNNDLNIKSGEDTQIGRDVVGGDSNTTTTTTTTTTSTINEGGPVARYAVLGVIGIAALAILVLAIIAYGGRTPPPVSTRTPTLTPPPDTLLPIASPTHTPSQTLSPTPPQPTDTASATLTELPSATPTEPAPPVSATPSPTDAPTERISPTPSPTSFVPLYDSFLNECLDVGLWQPKAPKATATSEATPTAIPQRGNCWDARRLYLAEEDSQLSVFLDRDATAYTSAEHYFQLPTPGRYKHIEVTLALNNLQIFTDTGRLSYLSLSIPLERLSGNSDLEIRLGGSNVTGRFVTQLTSRLTLSDGGGYQDFGSAPYTPGQVVSVAFRVKGNKLTAYVDNQIIAGPFSILAEPDQLTFGYYADAQTSLDGYFEEVRLWGLLASEITPPQ